MLLGVGKAQELPWRRSPAYERRQERTPTRSTWTRPVAAGPGGVDQLTVDLAVRMPIAARARLPQIYQADLAKIGVKLNIIKLDAGMWADQMNNRKYQGLYLRVGSNLHLSPGTLCTCPDALNPASNNRV